MQGSLHEVDPRPQQLRQPTPSPLHRLGWPTGFWAYDRPGHLDTFEPVDALAPGLVDAAVTRVLVVEMFSEKDTPATATRQAMQHLLDETAGDEGH